MTTTLDELLAMPTLALGPLPTLDDLGLERTAAPIDSAPRLAIPSADKITLEDLSERYQPAEDLVTPRGKGRKPPRWDDPRILALLGYLEIGAYRGQAITAAGLAERTVMRWLETGREEAERTGTEDFPLTFYRHFWQAFVRAETVPVIRALDSIRRAGERGGWRAAAWFLERRYPDVWGPKATAWKRDEERERPREALWESPRPVSRQDLEEKVLRLLGQREAG
jgi:hypothetical protein